MHQFALEECVVKVVKENGEENCSQKTTYFHLERTRSNTPRHLRLQELRRFKQASGNREDIVDVELWPNSIRESHLARRGITRTSSTCKELKNSSMMLSWNTSIISLPKSFWARSTKRKFLRRFLTVSKMKYFVHCVSKTTGKIRYVVSWGLLILPGWFCLFDLCCAWPSVGFLWYWSVPWRVVGENLLSRVWVCRFAISVPSWCPPLLPRFCDSWAQRAVEGPGKGGKARMPAAVRGLKANLISSARKKLKRSREQEETKGSWMFHLDGGLYQSIEEPTWKAHEESMTGIVFKLEGVLRWEILTSDEQAEYAERCGPRRVYCERRLGVRRFDRCFPTRHDEPYKDRQGHWKQLWPAPKAHRQALWRIKWSQMGMWAGKKECKMGAKHREVLTAPRKKAREEADEMTQGILKAPTTKFPPTTGVGDVQIKVRVLPQRKKSALDQACCRECGRRHVAQRAIPASRTLIRSDDAASMISRRIPQVMLASMVSSLRPAPPDYLDMTKKVRKSIQGSYPWIGEIQSVLLLP